MRIPKRLPRRRMEGLSICLILIGLFLMLTTSNVFYIPEAHAACTSLTITLNPTALTITKGSAGKTVVSVTGSGCGTVTLSISSYGSSAGISGTFDTISGTLPLTSNLYVSVAIVATGGTLTIRALSNQGSVSTTKTIVITVLNSAASCTTGSVPTDTPPGGFTLLTSTDWSGTALPAGWTATMGAGTSDKYAVGPTGSTGCIAISGGASVSTDSPNRVLYTTSSVDLSSKDFVIDTKLTWTDTLTVYHSLGVEAFLSTGNLVDSSIGQLYSMYYANGYAYGEVHKASSSTYYVSQQMYSGPPTYLRLMKVDTVYTMYAGSTYGTWTQIGTWTGTWSPSTSNLGLAFDSWGYASTYFSDWTVIWTKTTTTKATMTVSYVIPNSAGSGYSAPILNYVRDGFSQTYTLTTTATGVVGDYASVCSVTPNPLTGSTTSERWYSTDTLTGLPFVATTRLFTFYHQYLETVSYTVSGGGSPTAPTYTANSFGSATGVALSGTGVAYWRDAGSWSVTNPLGGSTGSERWYTATSSGTISSSATTVFSYQHQYTLVVNSAYDTPTGAGWFNAGASVTASVTTPTSGSPGIQYVCTGYTGTGSAPSSGSSSTVTFALNSASSVTFAWKTQYQLTMAANPSNGGTTTPTIGQSWWDAGSNVQIDATPAQGFAFSSWTGSGAGSYTGSTRQVTITTSAPTSETANFIQTTLMTVSYAATGGGSGYSAPVFNYVQGGQGKHYNLTVTPAGVSCDPGSAWSVTPNPLSGSTVIERWHSNQQLSGTASAQTIVFTFYHQHQQTLSYTITGGGSGYTAPTFTANMYGASAPQVLTTSATSYWYDAGSAWSVTNPLSGSGSSERWYTSQTVSGTISSDQMTVFGYLHQYYLTLSVTPSGAGTTVPSTDWQSAGASLQVTATANEGYSFMDWAGSGSGSYTGTDNPASITVNAAITELAEFSASVPPGPSITITSNPTGTNLVKVDSTLYATPHVFAWTAGSQHTLEALSPVSAGANSWYIWTGWSDGGLRIHSYTTPSGSETITATYTTQSGGTTWYVDGALGTNDGSHGTGPGASAFRTIQYAVSDSRVLSGHMIMVASGTYSEWVTINKANLALQGVGYPVITFRHSPVVLLAANGITLNGFEIHDTIQYTGSWTGNALVSDSGWGPNPSLSGFTISDCKFHDSDYGISTQAVVGAVTVRNSEFYALKRDGVHLSSDNLAPGHGTMTVDIHDNWFHNYQYDTSFPKNGKDTASVGMDNSNGWISGSVYRNYISGMKLGLRVYYSGPTSGQLIFSHNTIDQTSQPTGSPTPYGTMGFSFWGVQTNANNIIVRDNIFANAGWYGIYQETDDQQIQGSFQIINNLFYNNYKYSTAYAGNHYPYEWAGNDVIAQAGWLEGPLGGFTFTNDITAQNPLFAYASGGPSQQWAFTSGSSAYHTASDGSNIGAWQGTLGQGPGGPTVAITITSSPTGSGFVKIDNVTYTTPHSFNWTQGALHTLKALSPVSGGQGAQYNFTSWSDGGAQTHTYTTPASPQIVTANFVSQYQMIVSYQIIGGGSGYSAPAFSYYQSGASKQQALAQTPAYIFADAGTQWLVTPNPLTGSGSSERWRSSAYLGGSVVAGVYVFSFQHQYYLTMQVSPVGGGNTAPASGWQNAGAAVGITAMEGSGYLFQSWTGSGSGSYSGSSNPSNVTMSGAITETATFTIQLGGQQQIAPGNACIFTNTFIDKPQVFSVPAGYVPPSLQQVLLPLSQVMPAPAYVANRRARRSMKDFLLGLSGKRGGLSGLASIIVLVVLIACAVVGVSAYYTLISSGAAGQAHLIFSGSAISVNAQTNSGTLFLKMYNEGPGSVHVKFINVTAESGDFWIDFTSGTYGAVSAVNCKCAISAGQGVSINGARGSGILTLTSGSTTSIRVTFPDNAMVYFEPGTRYETRVVPEGAPEMIFNIPS